MWPSSENSRNTAQKANTANHAQDTLIVMTTFRASWVAAAKLGTLQKPLSYSEQLVNMGGLHESEGKQC